MRSPIFRKEYLGIQIGPSGDCNFRMKAPNPHCLVRNYDPDSFGTFYSATVIDYLVNARTSFDQFRSQFENAPHGTVHVLVGGDGGDMSMMHSPNDPLFWLHHAFIDKVWADRQKIADFRFQYDGRKGFLRSSRVADELKPFGVTVESVMATADLCYRYQPYSRRMTSSGLEVLPPQEVDSPIVPPKPLPAHWLEMHEMDKDEIAKEEKAFQDLVADKPQPNGDQDEGSMPQDPSQPATAPNTANRIATLNYSALFGVVAAAIINNLFL
jgi:hypothetical protein